MSIARLKLHSEPFAPTGSISGRGLRKLLGAPTLDTLETAVREAVQNSCDAARLGVGPEVWFRLRTLSREERQMMKSYVFGQLPETPESRDPLKEFLSSDSPRVMEICDFGSTGLGGPTRADRMPVDNESTDFIDFLRNVGIDRNTMHGGGTYGYGKVSLYRASRASTILVDTRTPEKGDLSRRLMACHLGESFEVKENHTVRRFTGRHWWGIRTRDGYVDPLLGDDAGALADALGFPKRGRKRTGTSIMIVDPADAGENLEAEGRRIVETLLWNFWPRMMQEAGPERQIRFRIEVEGRELELPRPEEFPPLDLFCRAMSAVRRREEATARLVRCERPKKDLGMLSIVKGLRARRRPIVGQDSVIPTRAAHIALMRPVELVVRYVEGDVLPDERLEWAGVFRADDDDEIEHAFATAEPPAHDDWIPDSLPKGREKSFVNVALKEIKKAAKEVAAADMAAPPKSGPDTPLARLAGHLGRLLAGGPGEGAGPRRGAGPGGGARQLNTASKPVFLRLEEGRNGAVAVFATQVRQDSKRKERVLKAEAAFALEGGSLLPKAEEGDPIPEIVSISTEDGTVVARGDAAALEGRQGTFLIRVGMPSDCAVTVKVQLTDV